MEVISNTHVNVRIKRSNNIAVTLSDTDELILLRLSVFDLNKKEISKYSNLNYKQILLYQRRIKRLMTEQNWERVLLKAFKKKVLLYSDYTLSEVSNSALIYAERIKEKMVIQPLYKSKVISICNYRKELFSFIEDTNDQIIQNLAKKQENLRLKKLSENKLTYLKLVSKGYTQPEILNELKINIVTAEGYKVAIFKYLDVKNWFNAVRMASLLDMTHLTKVIRCDLFNEIDKITQELNILKANFHQENERSLQIYMLLVDLFNKIEFNALFDNYNIEKDELMTSSLDVMPY